MVTKKHLIHHHRIANFVSPNLVNSVQAAEETFNPNLRIQNFLFKLREKNSLNLMTKKLFRKKTRFFDISITKLSDKNVTRTTSSNSMMKLLFKMLLLSVLLWSLNLRGKCTFFHRRELGTNLIFPYRIYGTSQRWPMMLHGIAMHCWEMKSA